MFTVRKRVRDVLRRWLGVGDLEDRLRDTSDARIQELNSKLAILELETRPCLGEYHLTADWYECQNTAIQGPCTFSKTRNCRLRSNA